MNYKITDVSIIVTRPIIVVINRGPLYRHVHRGVSLSSLARAIRVSAVQLKDADIWSNEQFEEGDCTCCCGGCISGDHCGGLDNDHGICFWPIEEGMD
jgi:hypothetical protein